MQTQFKELEAAVMGTEVRKHQLFPLFSSPVSSS